MKLWRISNYESLAGEGGRRSSARWHRAGHPVVYLAESAPGALLEVLVHYALPGGQLPEPYTLLCVEAPSQVAYTDLKVPRGAWVRNIEATRDVGTHWLRAKETALARVPSAVMPQAFNLLLNPLHPDARHVHITHTEQFELDMRLLRLQSKTRPN